MTVDVTDVVRVVAQWNMPESTISQMVYHYLGASGSSVSAAVLATAVEAQLQTSFANISARIHETVLGDVIQLSQWDFTLNQWDGIATVAMVGIDGVEAGEMLPHGAAGLVKISTALPRRQARKYVPGLAETQQGDGIIIGVALTDLALFAAALDSNLVAGSLTLNYGVFNTEPASPLFETFSAASGAVEAEGAVAYQRRRRPGTGI